MYTFSSSFMTSPSGKKCLFSEIKEKLESQEKSQIISAMHSVSRNRLSLKQKALIFPQIVSMILHASLEIKTIAYSFVLRCMEEDKGLLLLATNTVLQEIRSSETGNTSTHALRKSLAIDFASKIRDKEFLMHFYDEIEKALVSRAEIVRKSAILASPTLFHVFREANTGVLRGALSDRSAVIAGSAVFAIASIEKEARNTFAYEDLEKCVEVLCAFRAQIEESNGSFGVLFSEICRLLRPFPNKELLDKILPSVPFLPLYAMRELILSADKFLTRPIAERMSFSILSWSGTEQKTESLELLLLLLGSSSVKIDPEPFFIAGCDERQHKALKLQILSAIATPSAISEIRLSVRDKECSYNALRALVSLGAAQEEDVKTAFKYCPSSALKALYMLHPLPPALAAAVSSALLSLSNVSEKEAYLFLAGYHLSSVPDEAKRIRRIRNSAGGILYGRKEERERSEEHLEEYLYFLLNFYIRGIFSKEECVKHSKDAFSEEPFLLEKFQHLVEIPDKKHILELISYKRVSYRITRTL